MTAPRAGAPPSDEPPLRAAVSVQRAALALDVCEDTVRALLRAGALAGFTIGNGAVRPRLRVFRDSLDAYQQRRPTATAATRAIAAAPKPRAAPRHQAHQAAVDRLKALGVLR